MQFVIPSTLAQLSGASPPPLAAVMLAALALALFGLIARRRMPAGTGEGLFVGALSAGVASAALSGTGGADALLRALTGLAMVWYVLGRATGRPRDRKTQGTENRPAMEADGQRIEVFAYAALVCGLAVCGVGIARGSIVQSPPPFVSIEFAGLLLLALVALALGRVAPALYPAVAGVAALIVLLVPQRSVELHAPAWLWSLGLAAIATPATIVGVLLRRWWHCRRTWLPDPQYPPAARRPHSVLSLALVAASVLIGLGGLLLREHAFTPLAIALAGLSCLTIAHLRTWLAVGEIGLALIAESIAVASLAWLQAGWPGALLGIALAGGYMLWLARFWNQQLHDGVAWTTAGRLIPGARRLAHVAAAGTLAAGAGGFAAEGFLGEPVWHAAITTLLLAGGVGLLVRDACEKPCVGSAFAACLTMVAALGPAGRLVLAAAGFVPSPVVLFAAGVMLLALIATRTPARRVGVAYGALIGGISPCVVLAALVGRGLDVQTSAATGLCAVALTIWLGTARVAARTADNDAS